MNPSAHTRVVVHFDEGWLFVPADLSDDASWARLAAAGEPVDLPHTWSVDEGTGVKARRGRSTYAKRFAADVGEGETWLEFGGVNSSADVYLNGTHLAHHDGGYSTFRVDLTPKLRAENLLVVVADNAPNDTVYPQWADFTFYGGIYREVRLLRVPAAHFRLDDHGGPGLIVTPALDGDTARVHLRAEATGGDGVRFVIAGVGEAEVPLVGGVAETWLTIPDVRCWHGLRDPHLYVASATLLVGGEAGDRVELRFGCRTFEAHPQRGFLLNDEPYPLRGVSRHQDRDGVGNALSPEHLEAELDLIKEIGANSVRLAHYQHDQRFYGLCDEAGLVVWAEVPQITRFMPAGTANATAQLVELVTQNRHHASIVCWALSNEITIAGNSDELLAVHRAQNELVHRLDPTRPTAMAHAFLLEQDDPLVTVADVIGYNLYYGWYVGELTENEEFLDAFHAAHPGVPLGLTEYGADANPRFQSEVGERGDYSEQYQAAYHEHLIDVIEERPWLWATYVWNLCDFGADGRNEGGAPGRNQKGLITFDRSLKKDAFYLYKAAWSAEPFVHVAGRRYADRTGGSTTVTVYSNQPEVTLHVDGELLATRAGRRVFRFEVPLRGEHEVVARAGELSDAIRIRWVAEPNPAYRLNDAVLTNWFDGGELPRPDGRFSIYDTFGAIKANPAGRVVADQLMAAALASRGEVGKKIKIPKIMQRMIDGMTVHKLLRQFGGSVTPDQVAQLNATLNQIAK